MSAMRRDDEGKTVFIAADMNRHVELDALESPDSAIARVLDLGCLTEYRLATLYEFRIDLEGSVAQHTAIQQYWDALTLDLSFKLREFEEDGYARWWAHVRRFVRYAHRSVGTKETIEALRDSAILMFSSDLSADARESYVASAWRGQLVEFYGSDTKAAKIADHQTVTASFAQEMYCYYDQGWTYEKITSTHRSLAKSVESAKSVAKNLNTRAYKMKEYADLEKAKFSSIGIADIKLPTR